MATGDTAVVTAPGVGERNPASKGQAKTMQGMATSGATNPYRQFGEDGNDDKLSVDDGINMGENLIEHQLLCVQCYIMICYIVHCGAGM